MLTPECQRAYALYFGGYITRIELINANIYKEYTLYQGLQRKSAKNDISILLNIYLNTLVNVSSDSTWSERMHEINKLANKLYACDMQNALMLKHLNTSKTITSTQSAMLDMFKILQATGYIDDE